MRSYRREPRRANFTASIAGGLGIALLSFGPAIAQSQSCYALRQESATIQSQAARLVSNYPGTSIVLGACVATASSTYDRYVTEGRSQQFATDEAMATFVTCAGLGCLLVGYSNCLDVATRVFELGLRGDQVEQQMRRQRCPQ